MIQLFTRHLLALLVLLVGTGTAFAQKQSSLDQALRYIESHAEAWGLSPSDIQQLSVSDDYVTAATGVRHVYFLQTHAGIEVYNAMINVTLNKDGEAVFAGNRAIANVGAKTNTTLPGLTAAQAIEAAADYLLIPHEGAPRLAQQSDDQTFEFLGGDISAHNIIAKLRYQPTATQGVRLAWDLAIDVPTSADYWSLRVDAVTGEILNKNNYTVYCKVDHSVAGAHSAVEEARFTPLTQAILARERAAMLNDGASYFVVPFPAESPNHGDLALVTNPADTLASPYGWHDTDGEPGAEYTITRGNNVHAFLDLEDTGSSSGDEPDGGAELVFDVMPDFAAEPSEYQDAAVINLFYAVNFLHDFTYRYGFDEPAGNFQQNNYGNGGAGNDYVLGNAQDGASTNGNGPDGDHVNNANFATPPDGSNGQMQMYWWNRAGASNSFLSLVEPLPAAQGFETGLSSDWGLTIDSTVDITAQAVFVDDGVFAQAATDGCETIINTDQVAGRIALIDRGACFFHAKAVNAEAAGAVGVVICNFEDAIINMAADPDSPPVNIPAVFVSSVTCNTFRQILAADNVLVLNMSAPDVSGPEFVDGDFDNGIIAHEFGHGVSTRLTGGPGLAGCLGGEEQMGEGWSDFFTLVTTVTDGDVGSAGSGIGTYATREPVTGRGIRSFPYSTDMGINPHTYADIQTESVPHGVGSVWAVTLWDMYWAFVEEYGYDADPSVATAGNNMAIALVMDGMKEQPCSPGFQDGRDAILLADALRFNGDNQCMIWEVFARRGMGFNMDQGSSDSRSDGIEDFEPLPTCIRELKIDKTVTSLIEPGENITVSLEVINHLDENPQTVTVRDELPAGTSLVPGSATIDATVNGSELTFELGDLAYDTPVTITYELATSADNFSVQQRFDDFPNTSGAGYDVEAPGENFNNLFELADIEPFSAPLAWFVADIADESEQVLRMTEPITVEGDFPAFRMYHWYDVEAGADGGIVEVRPVGADQWTIVQGDMFIRNGYPRAIQYGTFVIPNLEAYTGDTGGEHLDTYIDLRAFSGQEIEMRWRFATDDNTEGIGWSLDDFEFMDLLNYNTQACATTADGKTGCDTPDAFGTIVNSRLVSGTDELPDYLTAAVFPNPATETINVRVAGDRQTRVGIRLMTAAGRVLAVRTADVFGSNTLQLPVAQYPAGLYLVEISTAEGRQVVKVNVQ